MLAIVNYDDLDKVNKILGYSPMIYSFGDMFAKFKNSVKKSLKNLATEEIFSLSYNSLLSDLKKAVWVSITEDELPILSKKVKILETCN